MLLRKIGLTAAALVLTIGSASTVHADGVSAARKAIQAAYDKEAAAAAKLDVDGIFAFHSPDYVSLHPTASPDRRRETLKFIKEKATVFLRFNKSFKRKVVIRRFRLRGNVATVTCKIHDVQVFTNPEMTKVLPPDTDDYTEVDTWVKGAKGWLMTVSR